MSQQSTAPLMAFELDVVEVVNRTFRIEARDQQAALRTFEVSGLADLFEVGSEEVTNRYVKEVREVRKDSLGTALGGERLLEAARAAQTVFWNAVRQLEDELGCDIDATRDLEDLSIDDLRKEAEAEDAEG